MRFFTELTLSVLLTLTVTTEYVSGFQSPLVTSRSLRPAATTTTRRAIPVESFHDIHTAFSESTQAWSQLLSDPSHDASFVLDSTSLQLLAEATEVAAKNDGWWAAYLNIFKTCLLFVHNTIDAPLRSVGVTQTWGVAIAIFTACK